MIAAALRGVLGRADFRVVHFSIQGNHLHVLVEASDGRALANGMRALSGRIALGLNRLMGRRGRVFADRYHAHVLRTPGEARKAVAYVLGNFTSHASRRGHRMPEGWADPYASACARGPDGLPPPVSRPASWLLLAVAEGTGGPWRRTAGPREAGRRAPIRVTVREVPRRAAGRGRSASGEDSMNPLAGLRLRRETGASAARAR